MKLKHQIPNIYSKLLPEEFLEREVVEAIATCDACAMSKESGKNLSKKGTLYRADLKCCTFYPYMPNYLIGAILREQKRLSSQTVSTIDQIISENKYSLPIGFVAPIPYQIAFNKRQEGEFGQREDWLCPYYQKDKNNCGIWAWRGSVCTSFFCESSYGTKGSKFWAEVNNYLSYVEMMLMEEALVHLDFSPRQVSEMLLFLNRQKATPAEKKAWTLEKAEAKKLWNGYYDDQKGFFLKCLEIVEKMDRNTFTENMGSLGNDLEKRLLKGLNAITSAG